MLELSANMEARTDGACFDCPSNMRRKWKKGETITFRDDSGRPICLDCGQLLVEAGKAKWREGTTKKEDTRERASHVPTEDSASVAHELRRLIKLLCTHWKIDESTLDECRAPNSPKTSAASVEEAESNDGELPYLTDERYEYWLSQAGPSDVAERILQIWIQDALAMRADGVTYEDWHEERLARNSRYNFNEPKCLFFSEQLEHDVSRPIKASNTVAFKPRR